VLKKKKFLIGGFILLVAVGVLGFMAFRGAATYYYAVGEVITKANSMQDNQIRVAGRVQEGSVVRDNSANTIQFVLTDAADITKKLPIVYKGAVPDAFKEGNDAVVEGQLAASGTFKAQQIIVKCPSKYVPKQ
jgi:cytochrome c-type biogenesis protein CcmE